MSTESTAILAPSLTLGTAMWGWTVDETTAFALLDDFYAAGFRQIDTATNYPINKNPEDFRRAETLLRAWLQARGVQDLQIVVKIGSINNLRSPEHNLAPSFILINLDDYQHKFGPNLAMLMVHWDNRSDETEIHATLEAFEEVRRQHLLTGLSGIRYPEVYARLNERFRFDFHFQIKHNLLQSDYQRYAAFHGRRRFTVYGINAGGIKLNPNEYHDGSSLRARGGDVDGDHPQARHLRQIIAEANFNSNRPTLQSMNHLGMLYAWHSPDVESILIGPSRPEQLEDTLAFYSHLQRYDYVDVYERLRQVAAST